MLLCLYSTDSFVIVSVHESKKIEKLYKLQYWSLYMLASNNSNKSYNMKQWYLHWCWANTPSKIRINKQVSCCCSVLDFTFISNVHWFHSRMQRPWRSWEVCQGPGSEYTGGGGRYTQMDLILSSHLMN